MGESNRIDKLNSEFQKEIYTAITRKIKNPLITEMVSVTAVDASKDLSSAKVYISIFSTNAEKKKITFEQILKDAKKIRYEVSQSMRVRYVPEFRFILDESMDYGDKMDKLLNDINKDKK